MRRPKLLAVLETYKLKLKEWYDKKVMDDSDDKKAMGLVSDNEDSESNDSKE